MRKKPAENCQHGFIRASCVRCRKASFYRWNGKPTRNRTLITLSIEVVTREDDSLEVLADALAGDAINALLGVHKISACRIRQILYYSADESTRRRGIPGLGHEMPWRTSRRRKGTEA
jgi:hypothetical protein